MECKSDKERIIIPYGVTEIGKKAFMKNKNVLTVEIPDSVECIGDNAFSGCENLVSVTIPKSVKNIENFAFCNCVNLADVIIENGVESIGYSSFSNCKSLKEITIPESINFISNHGFVGCKSLESINVDGDNKRYYSIDGVLFEENFKYNAILFYPTAKKNDVYEIPNGVEKIYYFAFYECANLKKLVISSTVDEIIGSDDLQKCKKLESICVDENNGKYCSVNGVLFDKELTRLIVYPPNKADEVFEVPYSVSEIKLVNCSKLKKVVMSSYVSYFIVKSCRKFKMVAIPYYFKHWAENYKWVEDDFSQKPLAVEIEYIGEAPDITADKFFVIDNGSLIKYKSGKSQEVVIPQGVVMIEKEAFAKKENIEKIIIPDSVKFINQSAFADCKKLKEINIPEGVERLGSDIFKNCSELEKIRLQGNPNLNCKYSLFENSGLKNVEIGADLKKVSGSLFNGCKYLENIIVDNDNPNYCSVDGILFSKDLSTLVRFPSSRKCSTYKIPNTVKCIENEAFYGCENLEEIIIPQSVEIIGYAAFSHCESLDNIVIPNNIKIIEDYTFSECKNLKNIVIPESVKNIGSSAFSYCKKLKKIDIPDSVESMGFDTFGYDFSFYLEQITLPKRFKESIKDILTEEKMDKVKIIYK